MFYDNFLKLCNAIGKAPSAVALDIGINKSSVTGWKKRGSLPSDATAKKLADYFGITVKELMAENEKKPAPEFESELDIREFVCSLTREQLLDLIVEARLRLLDMEK